MSLCLPAWRLTAIPNRSKELSFCTHSFMTCVSGRNFNGSYTKINIASLYKGRSRAKRLLRVQELCESRGGRPRLCVLMRLTVSVDVKQHWTMLRHWSQFDPNNYVNRHPRTWSSISSSSSTCFLFFVFCFLLDLITTRAPQKKTNKKCCPFHQRFHGTINFSGSKEGALPMARFSLP